MSTSRSDTARRYSLVAMVAGLVAILAAIATPFLPVTAHDASIDWPNGQQLSADNASVVAPLTAQTARSLNITVGCTVLRDAVSRDGDSVIVATAPSSAPREIRNTAMSVTAGAYGVRVMSANRVLAAADAATLQKCSDLKIWADESALGAQFVGAGPPARGDPLDRPTVAGVFTSLTADQVRAAGAALSVHVGIDNAFDVTRTWLKTTVIVIGVLAALIALIALAKLDSVARLRGAIGGRRALLRLAAPSITDLTVTAALVIWHFLGAGTSEDGYIQVMGRNAADSGLLSNYYRFFGIPEAPFDWYYSFLSHWSSISTAGIWMRLPGLIAGLLSWFILSRVILPRLGTAVRTSRWAVFSGAAVFVVFWMAFCSGLRAEPIIVLGSLATWWFVESAIATRRLLPAALATFAALLTFAAGPQGVVAIAVLIVGSRPMLRIVRSLRREYGLLPLFASLASAASLIVFLVFRTQTIANIVQAVQVRYAVGPTLSWYQELMRYYFLTVGTPDAALAKRVPMLLLIVALGATIAIMLRRKRLAGFARGPVWRLIGTVLLTIGLLSFVPTKWTLQFGVFAGVAAALVAVSTAALIAVAGTSARALWAYLTVLLGACAVAAAGNNAWGWAYDYGIPWFDKAPILAGQPLSTLFLVLTGASFLVLVWVCVRPSNRPVTPETAKRRRLLAGVPVLFIAAVLVLAEFAMFGRAALDRSDTYTTFSANMRALTGDACGMADRVLVEENPNEGMLVPVDGANPSKTLRGESTGFTPDGVGFDLTPEPVRMGAGTIDVSSPGHSTSAKGATPGTVGGIGPRTVNGSRAALPFGLDPATTPVLGSFGFDNGTAKLTSGWYQLPKRDASPLIVLSAAGSIFSITPDGAPIGGRDLKIEFGTRTGGEFTPVGAPFIPIDAGPDHANRPWRNLRIPMDAVPAKATALRIVAVDSNLNPDEWLAVTPPRAPHLRTLQAVVGSDDPVLLDLSVGSQFPCQSPITARNGVFTVPHWRITPDRAATFTKSKTWQRAGAGGILSVSDSLTQSSTVATYLENDWYRDWGNLIKLTPLVPDAPVAHLTTTTSRQVGWSSSSTIVTGGSDD
ncbi:arabinosyltransferase domain-containing protein [Gordonia phthalatica]|nr:arabinosyltransferase domain-containing protein [Gordonia phthalatica]